LSPKFLALALILEDLNLGSQVFVDITEPVISLITRYHYATLQTSTF